MSVVSIVRLIGGVIFWGGFIWLLRKDWRIALAVFLMMWGNNIGIFISIK